jgi:hypothetical protein
MARTPDPIESAFFDAEEKERADTLEMFLGIPEDPLSPNPPKGGRRVSDLKPQEGAPVHLG